MALILPQSSLAPQVNTFPATPSAASNGVTLTGGAANTKGSWVQLVASCSYDVCAISLNFSGAALAGSKINQLVDLGIGGAGSETVLIPDMMCGSDGALNAGVVYHVIPVAIPKGTRIAARMQDAVGADTVVLGLVLHGGADIPPWRSFQKFVSLGADPATSGGVSITPGATGGTESAWTNIGSTLAADIAGIMPFIQSDTATMALAAYHIELGYSSTTLGEWHTAFTTNEQLCCLFPAIPHLCKIKAGTQMQARVEGGGTSNPAIQVGILGMS